MTINIYIAMYNENVVAVNPVNHVVTKIIYLQSIYQSVNRSIMSRLCMLSINQSPHLRRQFCFIVSTKCLHVFLQSVLKPFEG